MYVKRNYGLWMTFSWSMKPFVVGTLYATILCLCHSALDIHPQLPWQPISVIGIAVAFYLGFKNNSSYDRTREARKIWGGIVNNSRSFGAQVTSFVKGRNEAAIRKEQIYRHVAWLTALRYQLRLPREWEHTEERVKRLYAPSVEEMTSALDEQLRKYLPYEEVKEHLGRLPSIGPQVVLKPQSRDAIGYTCPFCMQMKKGFTVIMTINP